MTSSRQGESHNTPTGEEQGFWESSLEAVGDRKHPKQNKSMAHKLREKRLEKRKQAAAH